jgi:ribosomal 50S subunit-recycling heat shock protein
MLAGRVSSALAAGALAAAAAAPTAPPVRAWPMQLHRLALAAQRSSGITSTSGSDPESIVEGGRSGGTSYAAAAAPPRRQRLDDYVLSMHPEHSRNLVQSWIVQGKVLVNDKPVTKAGTPLPRGAVVRVTAAAPRYVCRAGLKLEAALAHFAVDVTGVTALDAGLSTGGFTDCMLQHGAHHVYGVDVGHGQVMGSIAQDPRVTVMEKTNLRHLAPSDLPEQVRPSPSLGD